MEESYSVAVIFPDQSLSFAYGFEAGQLYEGMKRGERFEDRAVRVENKELIQSLCNHLKRHAVFTETEVEGWLYFSDRPMLELVK